MGPFYLLLWTSRNLSPFTTFSIKNTLSVHHCQYTNCIITSDRSYFGRSIGRFNAIAFNGRNLGQVDFSILSKHRRRHQKYIFVMTESSENYPVLDSRFNNFFNWTCTYRLDSDIPYPYLQIKNKDGRIIGPKNVMNWETNMLDVDNKFIRKIENKSRAVAWFASHCATKSGRETYVVKLDQALRMYGYFVDIYGKCGPLRRKVKNCERLLENDYYFYLAFENSISKDYVTEKLLTALQHNTVPIVLGGANYSKFLPPGSYLNAREYAPHELAYIIRLMIMNSSLYRQFFRWKSYYRYEAATGVCGLCAALNDMNKLRTISTYENFKSWWNR